MEMLTIAATNTDEGRKRKQVELDLLCFKGDFAHNIKVLRAGGELIVWRQPSEENVNYQTFTSCTFCLTVVQKHKLWRHAASCPLNVEKTQADSPKEASCHKKFRQEIQMLLFTSANKWAECSERFVPDIIC